MRVAVRVEGERVVEAGFDARGCAAARAAGSAVVELVEGTPFLEAARLTADDVDAELGGLAARRAGTPPSWRRTRCTARSGAAARDGAPRLAREPAPDARGDERRRGQRRRRAARASTPATTWWR